MIEMKFTLAGKKVVIVADGVFPAATEPLRILHEADYIACCDGAAAALLEYGMEPGVIIGDMDSAPEEITHRFSKRLVVDVDIEKNDLTKAVEWCWRHGAVSVNILGGTGKREDHTLGNISLLANYGKMLTVNLITDTARIFPIYKSCTIDTFPGQKVSIFSLDSNVKVSSEGLMYPLNNLTLDSWWTATLNSATGSCCTLTFQPARLIIYLGHSDL